MFFVRDTDTVTGPVGIAPTRSVLSTITVTAPVARSNVPVTFRASSESAYAWMLTAVSLV